MKHNTNAYKDGFKWIIFCTVCGIEEPVLNVNGECIGVFRKKMQEELFSLDGSKMVSDNNPQNQAVCNSNTDKTT